MNKHGGYYGVNSKMLDFSININPLGMPPRLKYDLIARMDDLGRYPEPTGYGQRVRLAQRLGVPEDMVILGNGAIDLIYLYAQSVGRGDSPALIVVPTFNEYRRALTMCGWDPVIEFEAGPRDDFRIDPDALMAVVNDQKPRAVFICNPNNPTGMSYSPDYIRGLIEGCDPATHWFIDESFIDFSSKGSCLDMLMDKGYYLVLLRSMTKFFGVPGLRVGYAVAHPRIIMAMEAYQKPWSVNSLALQAMDSVFEDGRFIRESRSYMLKERHRMYVALSKLRGIKVYPSSADFHLCRLASGTARDLNDGLNVHGINIRTCEDFSGLDETYFRVAVKKKDDNDRLIQVLSEWVK